MTDVKAPHTEIEWSRRAIINVVDILAAHAESLTLVGAHAVLLRTKDLDAPRMPTGDGDLGVTPDLVGDLPSIEGLLAEAGYEHRTTARPGLWGREPYGEADGTRSFREKIDLLAPHGLSGSTSRSKRGVPALQPAHGKLTVGNALGLELAAFNRSRMTITDFANPRLSAEIHVAEIPALILAKGALLNSAPKTSQFPVMIWPSSPKVEKSRGSSERRVTPESTSFLSRFSQSVLIFSGTRPPSHQAGPWASAR